MGERARAEASDHAPEDAARLSVPTDGGQAGKAVSLMRKVIAGVLIGIAALAVAIQVVPYGRDHANPPARREPVWDRPETRELARRACFDCHSNETSWPWYTSIAPVSWLAQRDVDEGRRKVNFSEWDRPQKEGRESVKTIRKGTMPPWFYVVLHPQAKLGGADREALIGGLQATLGSTSRREGGRGPGTREDRDDRQRERHR